MCTYIFVVTLLTVPLILGEDSEPEVKFEPSSIFLELAPLNTAVTASFKIISSDLSPKVRSQIIRNFAFTLNICKEIKICDSHKVVQNRNN